MKLLSISFLFFSFSSIFAGTFTTDGGAYFSQDQVKIYVASNTDCENAQTSKEELISMIEPAIHSYWNTVSTSRLELENGGEYQTEDDKFNTGRLCNVDTDDSCDEEGSLIPKVTEIVITCNSNTEFNFPNSLVQQNTYAITLTNNASGSHILGSTIIINNTPSVDSVPNPFSELTDEEKIAVLSHEIGHAIGIGHTPRAENIMYFTPTPERFSLGADDVWALTYLYPKKFDGCGMLSLSQDNQNRFWPSFLLFTFLALFIRFFWWIRAQGS